jgi:polysaccharide pyruvyl transferase WcaK-like protein
VRALSFLRGIDVLVVAGSGQLLDQWRGPFGHPYTLFRWTLLARLARVPVLFPSVGAGPVDHPLSRFFIRSALAPSPYVSVRDKSSASVLRGIGVQRPLPYCPDMGYAYRLEVQPGRKAFSLSDGGSVGLNVIAHRDPRYWPRGSGRDFAAYLEKMAQFASWLLDQGFAVTLFSSQVNADALVAADLQTALSERGMARHPRLRSAFADIETVADLAQVVQSFDAVVAGRYHSVLLPVLLGIPTIGLAYHPKTKDLLDDLGLGDRCLDIDAFTPAELERRFLALGQEGGQRGKAVARRVAELRSQVEAQFDLLFGLRIDERR